ncbi:MAG: hypothetical protein ABIQ35_07665 [Verrucomicrobiota bacterium]
MQSFGPVLPSRDRTKGDSCFGRCFSVANLIANIRKMVEEITSDYEAEVKVLRDDLKFDAEGIGYTMLAWTRVGKNWMREWESFLERSADKNELEPSIPRIRRTGYIS